MMIRRITPLAVALAGGPLAAQGLPGLDNFSIERPVPAPVPSATPTPTPTPTRPSPSAASPTPTPSANVPRNRPAATPSASPTATPSPRPTPTTSAPAAVPVTVISPTPTASPPDPGVAIGVGAPAAPATNWPVWAALAALLVAIGAVLGAAGALWWRRRADVRSVPAEVLLLDAPAATAVPPSAPAANEPMPIVPELAPAAAPKARLPGGLITSSLKPALSFDLRPRQGAVDALRATVDYELVIRNTGRGPANDVVVEVWLLSGSAQQDDDLAYVLALDPGEPALPPFRLMADAAVDLSGQVVAPRETLAIITAGERTMFVPLIAIRAHYRDTRGTVQSASAAFMVGIDRPGSDRLAPLPLDRGAQVSDRLAARRYEVG